MKLEKSKGVSGPMQSAGLVRYFDVSGMGFKLSPEVIVGLTAGFLALEIAYWFFF